MICVVNVKEVEVLVVEIVLNVSIWKTFVLVKVLVLTKKVVLYLNILAPS